MRRTTVLCLLLAACGRDVDGPKTPEDLAKAVFAALKTDDVEAVGKLVATEADVEDMYDAQAAHVREAEGTIDDKRRKRGGIPGLVKRLQKKVRESFARVRAECAAKFAWDEAAWSGLSRERDQKRGGREQMDFYFQFRAGGKLWRIKLDDCVLLNERWVLRDEMRFMGEDAE